MKPKQWIAGALLCAFAAIACGAASNEQGGLSALEDCPCSPAWVGALPEAETAEQLLVVAAGEDSTAWVTLHGRAEDGSWRMLLETAGIIGQKGLGKTAEGDGKTPVGCFCFNAAFGIADDPGCAIPYTRVTDDLYWSGDQREGMHYNELVSIQDCPALDTAGSEHLIDYPGFYQYCLNISYNASGLPGAGSAIFLHCAVPGVAYTHGCVAIPEEQMLFVMRTVSPSCVVLIGEEAELTKR